MRDNVASDLSWAVSGTYFEACNCDTIPQKGQPSSYDTCDFALSWRITEGHIHTLDLSGLEVVMAGSYSNHEPRTPWRVMLYVDEAADAAQQRALADIFLGRAGGTTLRNFAAGIVEIAAVRPTRIALDHTSSLKAMEAGEYVLARTQRAAPQGGSVLSGVAGHDRPGQVLVLDLFRVADPPFRWEVRGRCGFAAEFAYNSDS